MKKFLSILGTGLGIIIGVPIALVVCIGYLLFVPFDIIRYHRMPYYKDFKKKYRFFITADDIVLLYNRIVKERLPIEYVKNEDYEYFIKDGQVLLTVCGHEAFKHADGEWVFVMEDERETITMEKAMSEEKELLKPEHRSLPAKFLIFYNDITDAEKFEQAKACPYLYSLFSADEVI